MAHGSMVACTRHAASVLLYIGPGARLCGRDCVTETNCSRREHWWIVHEKALANALRCALSPICMRCALARSGFTFNIPNDGCPTPDCDANCGVFFCKQTSEELWWKCGWRGDQLKAMLTMHARLRHNGAFRIGGNEVTYNEVVIDTAGYFGTMPRSVAAFFYTAKANPEQRASARKAHERFLAKYGGLAKGTPLLVYDSSKRGEPFSTAEAGE